MEFSIPAVGNSFLETTSYISYYSPHYVYANGSWTDSFQISQHPVTEVRQMHHIRFPTPPTTPPEDPAGSSKRPQPVSGYNQRTQSVIMKIGQCENTYQKLYEIEDDLSTGIVNSENPGKSSNFICNWINCKRYFEKLEKLADHVNKEHAIAATEDGLYYCQWDGCSRFDRGFNARYKMLVHVRTHTKEKPHHCHLCDKCFSRAENLKIHIRSHSGEKPYTCTYEGCQKAYSNSSDRFKHTRTHSMEKPYICKVPGCQKRYTDPSSLRKHVKTFKHAEQLMNSTSSSLDSNFESKDCNTQAAQCMDTTHNGYCVNSTEDFYIDIDDRNYCYNTTKSKLENSWISDNDTQFRHKKTFFVDMNLGIELPLDLRINRIV